MSSKKRARGERNWSEPTTGASVPKLQSIVARKRQKQFFDLRVLCLDEALYQFMVTDTAHDVEWLVQQGVDGTLAIDERPDHTRVKDTTVLAAIYRGWPQLKE